MPKSIHLGHMFAGINDKADAILLGRCPRNMIITITPPQGILGSDKRTDLVKIKELPLDKSILHRLLIIGSLTSCAISIPIQDRTQIGEDVIATILALESLGVPIDLLGESIELQGVGLHGLRAPTHKIDCANSGTTARLLMGLLAAQPFSSVLIGDASLSKRPMKRLAELLNREFGAAIQSSGDGTLPVSIEGSDLHSATVDLPVASAQIKSAASLAAMYAAGTTQVREPGRSRNHTERMLEAFGWSINITDDVIQIQGKSNFKVPEEFVYNVPCDLSSAAFLIAASISLRQDIRIENVSLNPTRWRFLDVLRGMGATFEILDTKLEWGEERGTLVVRTGRLKKLKPFSLSAEEVPLVIDELPILSLLAAFADGESSFRGAEELRIKESDRIRLIHEQLTRFGVNAVESNDGLTISGSCDARLKHCELIHGGDHRLAMTFAIGALFADGSCKMENAECVSVSFPGFFEGLERIAGASVIDRQESDEQKSSLDARRLE